MLGTGRWAPVVWIRCWVRANAALARGATASAAGDRLVFATAIPISNAAACISGANTPAALHLSSLTAASNSSPTNRPTSSPLWLLAPVGKWLKFHSGRRTSLKKAAANRVGGCRSQFKFRRANTLGWRLQTRQVRNTETRRSQREQGKRRQVPQRISTAGSCSAASRSSENAMGWETPAEFCDAIIRL